MNSSNLKSLSGPQLVDAFIRLAENRGEATIDGDVPKANRAARRMFALDDEFKERGMETRRLLLPLLSHENSSVRYNAARRLLKIAPDRARKVIEQVAAGVGPIAGAAGMTLHALDTGVFKPD